MMSPQELTPAFHALTSSASMSATYVTIASHEGLLPEAHLVLVLLGEAYRRKFTQR
jgi:hypothetical protein